MSAQLDNCACPFCRMRRGMAAIEDAREHMGHPRFWERLDDYRVAIHDTITATMTPVADMHDIPLRTDQEACIQAIAALYLGMIRSSGIAEDYGVMLLQNMTAARSRETDRRLS